MFQPRTSEKFRPKTPSRQKTPSEISADTFPPESQPKVAPASTAPVARATAVATTTTPSISAGNNNTRRRRIASLALVTLGGCSSLNAPLRSILNGFYYLAAIVSLLLLLVAYLHQVEAARPNMLRIHQQIEVLQLAPTGARSAATSAPPTSGRPRLAEHQSDIAVAGTKTAARRSQGQPTDRSSPSVPSSGSIGQKLAPPQQQQPELTFRQAAGSGADYSQNNRGYRQQQQPTFNETLLPSSSQWKPILHERRAVSVSPSPPPQQQPQPLLTNLPPPAAAAVLSFAVAPSVGHETRHRPAAIQWDERATSNLLNHQSHHHRHYHHHRPDRLGVSVSESVGQRTWRRPRFNGAAHLEAGYQRQSKMYKRVLICDKTLVSLDYVRDFAAEPRPAFPMAHYSFGGLDPSGMGNFLDDNLIDLDQLSGPPHVEMLDRRASTLLASSNSTTAPPSSLAASTSTSSTTSSTTTTTSAPGAGDLEDISATSSVERRSYQGNVLPDDDALVKCDMWDLEKGLKNRKPPVEILDLAVKADFDTVRDAINRCRQLTEKTLPPDDEYRDGLEIMSTEDLVSLFSMKRGLLPGTKWCGLGDQASTYNDLGPKHRIDICCRAHDHCPIRLKPFRNDYGVLNIALYTKSHCDCDADFYRCLREAHSRTADMLGNLYFNVMKLQCIREERLKVCREVRPIALGFERCVRYEENPMRRVFKFTTPPVAY